VLGPGGEVVFDAPLHDEGLFIAELDLAEVRRQRVAMPLLRDERPEVVLRQLERIVRERAGELVDDTAERGSLPGFDVALEPAR
jgi:hypothetical protein